MDDYGMKSGLVMWKECKKGSLQEEGMTNN